MNKTLTYFRDAFGSAVIVAIIWHFGNGTTIVNGKGWFERQAFPLNNMACCIAAGALLGAVGAWGAHFLRDRRRQAMASAAAFNRMNFEPKLKKTQLGSASSLRLLDNWDEGRNLIDGFFEGVDVSIFDLHKKITTRSSASSQSSSTRHECQTVFLLRRPESGGLTAQFLRKDGLGFAVMALDLRGVEFEPVDAVVADDDRRLIDEFNKTYLVTQALTHGGAKASQSVTPDDQLCAGLEQIVNMDLIVALLSTGGWNVELGDSHIAIWRHKKQIRPSTIRELLPQIRDVFHLLSGDLEKRRGLKLKASGTTVISREIAFSRIGLLVGSGCLGMILAAIVFIPLFLLYAKDYPWLVFAWPFFGMAVVAAVIKLALVIQRRISG
ncbi:MAG: hypothetical protein QGG71_24985 [Pirellulaceae bacterium]|jgi:hypothetical protein|nr:hypothetical protein [Pirellulaceae bacterium]